MSVIFSASTSLGSPNHTSLYLRPILRWFDPHMSDETFEVWHHVIRKCAHFTEYAILGFLAWRTIQYDKAFTTVVGKRTYRLAILFCAFYASTDEFHQSFVPTRQPAVLDVTLDTFGASCGVLLVWVIRRLRKTDS